MVSFGVRTRTRCKYLHARYQARFWEPTSFATLRNSQPRFWWAQTVVPGRSRLLGQAIKTRPDQGPSSARYFFEKIKITLWKCAIYTCGEWGKWKETREWYWHWSWRVSFQAEARGRLPAWTEVWVGEAFLMFARVWKHSQLWILQAVNSDSLQDTFPRKLVDSALTIGCSMQFRIMEHDQDVISGHVDVFIHVVSNRTS